MAFCKLLLTALVLLLNSGSLLGGEFKSSIIGGEDAEKGKWPWMVHLNMTGYDMKKWRCGGTIVGKQWVMTAAHCLDNNPNYHRSFAVVGAHELTKGASKYMGIYNRVTHPEYQDLGNGNYINDIALLKLKKTITFSKDVDRVSLPNIDDTFGLSSECWITGWGDEGNNSPLPRPETLQQLKIPLVDQSTCKAVYPWLTADMLCAGDRSGGKDACKGDDGGPLVCRKGPNFVQVGIMSYGSRNGCGRPGEPGVYTQVSKYLTFINEYIDRTEETSADI